MRLLNWFSKKRNVDFKFIDRSTYTFDTYPIEIAKDVKPSFKDHQEKVEGSFVFPGCPGMHDYSRIGYIIPAWSDFFIKANKAGLATSVGAPSKLAKRKPVNFNVINKMDLDITNGVVKFHDGVSPNNNIIGTPWKIESYNRNLTALILPAYFHINPEILENIHIYPGCVDFGNGFHAVSFVFSVKRKCEFVIKAGEPLLQFIPYSYQNVSATFGPPKNFSEGNDNIKNMYTESHYRRYHLIKKKYFLSLEDKLE